jgi:hypothetical protein
MATDATILAIGVESKSIPVAANELKALEAQAGKTEASAKRLGEGFTPLSSTLAKTEQANNALIESWTREVTMLGKTKNEMMELEARHAGMNKAQMENARVLQQSIKTYEDAGKAARDLAAAQEHSAQETVKFIREVGVIATVVATALSALYAVSVKNASEAEQAEARLTAVLKATGGAAGVTKGHIDDLAESLALITNFDDEALRHGAATLLTFGSIGASSFDRALKAGVDLAAFMRSDLDSAMRMIGKALEDPTVGMTAMRRAGIMLTDSQMEVAKAAVEAGDKMAAMKVLLEALESKVGGTAIAMRTGLTGATSDAGKAFDEMTESMGKSSLVAGTYTTVMGTLTEVMRNLKKAIDEAKPGDLAALVTPDFGLLTPMGGAKYFGASRGGSRESSGKIGGLPAAEDTSNLEREANALNMVAEARKKAGAALAAMMAGATDERQKFADAERELRNYAETLKYTAPQIDAMVAVLRKSILGASEKAAADKDAADKLKLFNEQLRANNVEADKESDALKKSIKEMEAYADAYDKSVSASEKSTLAMEKEAEQETKRAAMIGLTKEQVDLLKAAWDDEKIARAEAYLSAAQNVGEDEAEIERLQRKVIALKGIQQARRDAAVAEAGVSIAKEDAKLAKEMERNWEHAYKAVGDAAGDFLLDFVHNGQSAFKNLWESFKNWGLQALAQIAAKQVMVSIFGTAASGAAGAAGSAGGSMLGGAQGGFANYATSSLLGSAGSATTGSYLASGWAGMFGPSASTAALAGDAFLPAALGAEGLGAASLGEGMMAGLSSGLALIPVAGWVALAALVVYSIYKGMEDGPAMRTGTFASGAAAGPGTGNPLFQSSSQFGSFGVINDKWFSDSDMGESMKVFLATIKAVDNAIADMVDGDMESKIKAALESVRTEFKAGMEKESVTFGEVLKDRYVAILDVIDPALGNIAEAFEGTGEELVKLALDMIASHEAMQRMNLADVFGEVFDVSRLQDFQKEGESLSATLIRLTDTFVITTAVADLIGSSFGNIGLESTEARERLVSLAGGVSALGSAANAYYEAFYTDAEKLTRAQNAVAEAFNKMGLALPDSISGFRSLVEALDLDTEAGAKLLVALWDIAPAFADVANSVAAAKASLTSDQTRFQLSHSTGAVDSATITRNARVDALLAGDPNRMTDFTSAYGGDYAKYAAAVSSTANMSQTEFSKFGEADRDAIIAIIDSVRDLDAALADANVRVDDSTQLVSSRSNAEGGAAEAYDYSNDIISANIQLMRAQGDVIGALNASRAQELATIPKTETVLIGLTNALYDLQVQAIESAAATKQKAEEEAQRTWKEPQITAMQSLARMGAELRQLAANVIDSVAAMDELSQANSDYRNAVQQTVRAIEAMKVGVANMFTSTRESLETFGLSSKALYNRYRKDADAAAEMMAATSDPEIVASLATRINDDINNAFAVLDDPGKSAKRKSLLAYLDNINDFAKTRLEDIKGSVIDEADSIFLSVQAALNDAATSIANASKGQEKAADVQQSAANTILDASRVMRDAVTELIGGSSDTSAYTRSTSEINA